jgi:hypothetical protein
MSDNDDDEREKHVNEPAAETAHPFDQTNGIVEGLDGDADSPEHAEERTGGGEATGFLAVPGPGAQMPAGVIPVGRDAEHDDEDETDDPDAPTA